MDCGPPGSSVHGILQARILECIAIPFSRESSQPRGWTWVSCLAGRFFTVWASSNAHLSWSSLIIVWYHVVHIVWCLQCCKSLWTMKYAIPHRSSSISQLVLCPLINALSMDYFICPCGLLLSSFFLSRLDIYWHHWTENFIFPLKDC